MNNSLKLFFLSINSLGVYLAAFRNKASVLASFGELPVGNVFAIRKSGFFLLTPSP